VVEAEAREYIQQNDLPICARASPNGWNNESVFLKFLRDEIPTVLPGAGWLILDLFKAHKTDPVLDLIKQKGYTPFFIPAGCTSVKQVHDVFINRLFKQKVTEWYGEHVLNGLGSIKTLDMIDMIVECSVQVPKALLQEGIEKLVLAAVSSEDEKCRSRTGLG
jgi:hypothetical protein